MISHSLQWYGFGVSSNGNTKDHSILIIINITRIVNNSMLQNNTKYQ